MHTQCNPQQLEFAGVEHRRVVAAFDGGTVSSDGGALLQTLSTIRDGRAVPGFSAVPFLYELDLATGNASVKVGGTIVVLMGVAAVFLLLVLVFGWIGKRRWIRTVFWVECLVAIVYAYSGPFSIANKIDTFESMHSIDAFLEDHLERDEFYRVYVDLSRFDVVMTGVTRL